MIKGINLQATIRLGTASDAAAVQRIEKALPDAFAQANPGLQLTVKAVSPADARRNSIARVYIQGEQDPAADFAALAHSALTKAVASMNAGDALAQNAGPGGTAIAAGAGSKGASIHLHDIHEIEEEDGSGLVLAPTSPQEMPNSATLPATQVSPTSQAPAASPPARRPAWWAFWRRGGRGGT